MPVDRHWPIPKNRIRSSTNFAQTPTTTWDLRRSIASSSTNYPSVRAAWADLLRDRIDMLYEVSADALDSLTGATTVSVFSFTRPYQYVIAFNQRSPTLRSSKIRRALNAAIDRAALVRDGLDGRGYRSSGPIWPQHWALARSSGLRVRSAAAARAGHSKATSGLMASCCDSSASFPAITNGWHYW